MKFTPEQTKELEAKLDRTKVKEREQGGRQVSYIEGWHAISEANRIFGFDGWSRSTIRLEETNRDKVTLKGRDNTTYEQWRVGYLALVRIQIGDLVREGTGFGSGMSKPEALGDAIESAIKEAETDAMKRCFMTFGNPFGLALYDKSQENVAMPVSAAVLASCAAIDLCGDEAVLTKWGTDNGPMIQSLPMDDARAIRNHYGVRLEGFRKAAA